MTIREAILERVGLDLLLMRVANGYQLDWHNAPTLGIDESDDTNYPKVVYDFAENSETNTAMTDGGGNDLTNVKLEIGMVIGEYRDKGMLVRMREQAISDMRKFIYGDHVSISENKYLQWSLITNSGLNGDVTPWEWILENVSHQEDYSAGTSRILFTVSITFPDFHNEQLNTIT